jgi:protein tyrosine phosphatase
VKAQTYWPRTEGESMILDGIGLELQLNKITIIGGITARSLTLSQRTSTNLTTRHDVLHLHYTMWPDHGAPTSTEDICRMLDLHDRIRNESNSGPTVVHCSAGIGRSGAFIAADMLIKRMKGLSKENQKKREEGNREKKKSSEELSLLPLKQLKKIVKELREQRRGMVQTEDQYKFVYRIYKEMVSHSVRREENLKEVLKKEDNNQKEILVGIPTSPTVSSWVMSPAQSPTYATVRS